MAINLQRFMRTLTQMVDHHTKKAPHNPALDLAQLFTGNYGFLDEQTQKSHQLSISPELDIKIDGQSLPGQVTGITTDKLTFLDHYGYQLIVTFGPDGPEPDYAVAENPASSIVPTPTTTKPTTADDAD